MGYAVVTKGSVRFSTKVTIFLKSWPEIWVEMWKCGKSGWWCKESRWKLRYSSRNEIGKQ